jgi:cellulose synthase/poly-beta-1,6-N-acetylglucosamine synthase-like glycosyltransferase
MGTNISRPPTVAVVIPSLTGDVSRLLRTIEAQTLPPTQIEVVHGVRPNGRARNIGAARTTAEVLIFIDDDAILGHPRVLEQLVKSLADLTVGVSGTSKLIPPGSNRFQRWVAREVPRIEHPIVSEPLETNPDPPGYYCEITTTCAALRRQVFDKVGKFNEGQQWGVDTEFFVRVRRAGYRLLLVPNTWVWHPAPSDLCTLLRKQFRYGLGHAQEVRRDPTRARGRTLRTPLHALAYLVFRTVILIPNVFLPYSFTTPSWRPGFKPLKSLMSYVSALGYVWGWYVAS